MPMDPASGGRSHERSLLLENSEDQDDCHSLEEHSTGANATPPLYTLFLCFMALHFLISFNEMILVAPLIKLFENSLCFSYYDIHDPSVISPGGAVEESLCKIPEIQAPLATIRGWKSFCDTIPVLLLAIPYGKLGDRIGHRKVMSMSLVGIAASLIEIFIVCSFPRIFPLQLVWLSSIFLLFGGGLYPFAANMWAMASEAIPAERRSVTFYYMFSAFYVAELVASFIATVTTEISPWIPCGLAFGSLFVNLLLLWVMPDPRKSSHYLQTRHTLGGVTTASTKQVLADGIHAALTNRNILLTIPVFLVGTVRFTTLQVLIQYASVRFGMKVSRGASFYTEAALVTIFLFLFLIPRTCNYIREKYNVRPQLIDLVLARTSVMCLFTGAILLGLAPSFNFIPIALLIFSAGFGTRASALSLVSYWISDSSKATLFAGIAVLENIGHAVGDPGMMQVLALALRLPPAWLGLPFFVVSAIYSLAIVSTWFIRLDKDDENDRRED